MDNCYGYCKTLILPWQVRRKAAMSNGWFAILHMQAFVLLSFLGPVFIKFIFGGKASCTFSIHWQMVYEKMHISNLATGTLLFVLMNSKWRCCKHITHPILKVSPTGRSMGLQIYCIFKYTLCNKIISRHFAQEIREIKQQYMCKHVYASFGCPQYQRKRKNNACALEQCTVNWQWL